MKKITLHITGTHCASCKILIEDIMSEQAGISHASVDLACKSLSFDTEYKKNSEELAVLLTEKLRGNGYTLSVEKKDGKKNAFDAVFWQALPIGLIILAVFFMLQKSGLLNFGFAGEMSFVTALTIGLVASVSSCLAVVGGLVLSLSATASEDSRSDTKTFVLFHAGRIVSFAILGGVLGSVGAALGINYTFTAVLGILASLVMLFLGLHLIGVFATNKLTLGGGFFNSFRKIENTTYAPLIVGAGTFFLPCGFTQAMQVAAIASGSFLSGSIIMFAFSLGTLPMLSLLSFGSTSFSHSKHAPLFFKSAGIIVVGLAVVTILAGLAGIGIIEPLFNI